jgi:hypothetical protein
MTADQLWAPPLDQKLRDQLPQFAVGLDAPPMIADPTRGRARVGIERTVTPIPGRVAAQLARDRRSAISIRSSCDSNLRLI